MTSQCKWPLAPKWIRALLVNQHISPLKTFLALLGIQLSIYTPYRHQIAFVCVHAPRGLFRLSFFAPTSSPQQRKASSLLHFFAALLCTPGNCFRPYLSISACAIEAQHDNENCSTVSWNICKGFVCLIPLQFNLSFHEFHASFRSTQRLFSVKYLFGEADIAQSFLSHAGRLKISRRPFHLCTIFETYQINSLPFSED